MYLDRAPLSSKLYGQYAKAREAGGQFLEAAKAYERAKDYDNATRLTVNHATVLFFLHYPSLRTHAHTHTRVCRLYLEPLQLPDEAVRVVKSSQSTEGAQIVAR